MIFRTFSDIIVDFSLFIRVIAYSSFICIGLMFFCLFAVAIMSGHGLSFFTIHKPDYFLDLVDQYFIFMFPLSIFSSFFGFRFHSYQTISSSSTFGVNSSEEGLSSYGSERSSALSSSGK